MFHNGKSAAGSGDFFPSTGGSGSADVKRWDHLVAVSKGGETVLGNMVLACQPCDDSKGNRPFAEWMISNTPKSPLSQGIPDVRQRIEHITSYVKANKYVPRPLEERLAPSELQRMTKVRAELNALRTEVESLISDYRRRMGYS